MESRRPASFSPPPFEPVLARGCRRAGGVYYTPPEIARLIAERTLAPLPAARSTGEGWARAEEPAPLRILDPACGAGEILLAAREELSNQPHELFGIDIDPVAVAASRQRLGLVEQDADRLRVADALHDETFPRGAFDGVIGNPPYVNIRELAKQRGQDSVNLLRKRFRAARGHFDLYVLFIERALEWLKPGGCCGLIVPNKWATLDYARECRRMLLEQTAIVEVIDLTSQRIFRQACVYPHVLIFRKQPAAADHTVRVEERCSLTLGADNRLSAPRAEACIEQSSLRAESFQLRRGFCFESQAATLPLGQIARLECGTTGYAASQIGNSLTEAESADSAALSFITSGNIDRYAVIPGNVRFLGNTWRDPRLPLAAPPLTSRQRKLFAAPKIVIAGMSRRLEAAFDERGLALGVQVFAATAWQVDPHYLLAVLNSKLLTYLFRTRFAAKRLAGGYLAVNKGQLARLPIVAPASLGAGPRSFAELSKLAHALSSGSASPAAAVEARIDRLVYELYRLSPAQIDAVEQHFVELSPDGRRAA